MPEEEEPVKENNVEETEQPVEEFLNRITVKDGTRIHLINTEDLLYVQACGDYVTLVTPEGQYVKELTMKYLETHLSAAGFVRIHRSTIVNVTQISRVELFGKESYRLLLKNGDKLRVSLVFFFFGSPDFLMFVPHKEGTAWLNNFYIMNFRYF